MARRASFAVLTLLLVGAAAFLRDPSLFLEPRFWAEEGSYYFHSALQRGVVDGLFNVAAAPYNPYLHTLPLVATVAAAHGLPLELAPYGTVVAWVIVVAAVELVVLFGRAALLDPPPLRLLVALSPLLAIGFNENWVNTLGAHFYCDLALVLLLLEAPRVEGARRALGLAAFTVFAFLSPTSWFVLPAVAGLWLARWEGIRPYLAIAVAAAALQAIVHFEFFEPGGRVSEDPSALPHLFVSKLLLWPLLGHAAAEAYGTWAGALAPDAFLLAGLAAGAGAALLIAAFFFGSRRDATTSVLLATWLSAAAGYLFLGLSVGRTQLAPAFVGGRYAYFPAMLLFALLAHQLVGREAARHRLRFAGFAALLFSMMLVGALEFSYSGIAAARMRGQPWREEVARFREDAAYDHLRIAPPGWVVVVSRSDGASDR